MPLQDSGLESLVEQGKAMIAVPEASRDGLWAYNACKLSRLVVGHIEERWPPAQYVSEEVLGAFMRDLPAYIEEAEKADRAGEWAKYMPYFARNVRGRVVRLERYVQNPPLRRD